MTLARSLLRQNLYPVKIQEKRGALDFELTKEKVKKKELMHFTRQLAVFVKAGIPITEAMEIIGDETEDVALQRTITDDGRGPAQRWHVLRGRRQAPRSLPQLLHRHPAVGRADRQARRHAGAAWPATSSASSRPARRSCRRCPTRVSSWSMAMVTVVILAGYVLPQFKPLFEELERRPAADRRGCLLFIATLLHRLWYIPFSVLLCLRRHRCTGCSRHRAASCVKDRLVLQHPGHQGHRRVRDPRALLPHPRRMVKAGVPLPEGMKTTTESTQQLRVSASVSSSPRWRCSKVVASPGRWPTTELFPGAAKQMFKVGEETGTLDEQLEVASRVLRP